MNQLVVYPGSFDPVTMGHLDIMLRAAKVFDRLIIGVAVNPRKNPLFTADERVEMIQDVLTEELGPRHRIKVEAFEGLLVDYMVRKKARIVLRGLRALSDFEYEFQMALNNHRLRREVETFFLMTSESYLSVSSGIIKEIAFFGGNIKGMVPAGVEKRLRAKLGKIRKENLDE
jgi:pantetheine-phosphate adenylyltransferase